MIKKIIMIGMVLGALGGCADQHYTTQEDVIPGRPGVYYNGTDTDTSR